MKAHSIEEKRKENANAYYPWEESEEKLLIELLDTDKNIDQISIELKRSPGAIISRLRKLGYEFKKDKCLNYNEIAKWAKDYLGSILEGDTITYNQIAVLIKELIDAIQEPKLKPKENLNIKNKLYELGTGDFDHVDSGTHQKYHHTDFDDNTIDSAFDGDPSLVWNID